LSRKISRRLGQFVLSIFEKNHKNYLKCSTHIQYSFIALIIKTVHIQTKIELYLEQTIYFSSFLKFNKTILKCYRIKCQFMFHFLINVNNKHSEGFRNPNRIFSMHGSIYYIDHKQLIIMFKLFAYKNIERIVYITNRLVLKCYS